VEEERGGSLMREERRSIAGYENHAYLFYIYMADVPAYVFWPWECTV